MIINILAMLIVQALTQMSDVAQVSIGLLAYMTAGGTILSWYFASKIDRLKLELFKELDDRYVTRRECEALHKETIKEVVESHGKSFG